MRGGGGGGGVQGELKFSPRSVECYLFFWFNKRHLAIVKVVTVSGFESYVLLRMSIKCEKNLRLWTIWI